MPGLTLAARAAPPDYDVIVAGGGLRGCMAAIGLARLRPAARLLLLDRGTRFGGDRIDPFPLAGIPAPQRWMIETAIVREWRSAYVALPGFSGKVEVDSALVMPEQIHADVLDILRPDQWRLGALVARCDADGIVLVDGTFISAGVVLDFTRPVEPSPPAGADVREVVSHEVRFERPHSLDAPVLVDASLDGLAGSEFLQYFPLGADVLQIRRIRYGPSRSDRAFGLPDVAAAGGTILRTDRAQYPLGPVRPPSASAGRAGGSLRFDANALACDPALPSPVPAALMTAAALVTVEELTADPVRRALAAVEGSFGLDAKRLQCLARCERSEALRMLGSLYVPVREPRAEYSRATVAHPMDRPMQPERTQPGDRASARPTRGTI